MFRLSSVKHTDTCGWLPSKNVFSKMQMQNHMEIDGYPDEALTGWA